MNHKLLEGILMKSSTAALDTKYKIADTMMSMVLKESIDSISITYICDKCGITRKTFYNHFHDKYDLIDWIYRTEAVDYITLVGENCSWYDAVIMKLNIIKNNPNFYRKVYRQDWFLNSFYNITKQLYLDTIKKKGGGKETEFEVEFYCYACVKETGAWVLGGLKETPEELVKRFMLCLPDNLKRYLLSEADYEHIN